MRKTARPVVWKVVVGWVEAIAETHLIHLQEQVSAPLSPLHLLSLDRALAHNGVDGRLDELKITAGSER
jgi:hypothetical protein